MKTFIVFAMIAAVALAAPPAYSNVDEKNAEIRSISNEVDVNSYKAGFATSNGIEMQHEGQLVNEGTDNEAFNVRGSFSYPGPDGQVYTVTYTADADGFHPVAAHIPK